LRLAFLAMTAEENPELAAETGFPKLVPPPSWGRVFRAKRRVRLSDADLSGRLRLDAIARYLQDVATDDVIETGWGAPDHIWLVRRTQVRQSRPIRNEELVDLTTWSSGIASSSAARRTNLATESGGLVEAESIWVHLGPDLRPRRFGGDFSDFYVDSTMGRRISARLELPDPPAGSERMPWPLRHSDMDLAGHLNNAAYWEAVEEAAAREGLDLGSALEAAIEFRRPIDLDDEAEVLYSAGEDGLHLGLAASGEVRAVALVRTGA
jgi:acyl-ACP thioesterase